MLVYMLNSFSKEAFGGNPAGVVVGQSQLTLQQMQRAAKEVGVSETVFILESGKADFKARFFTPNSEVDLCGHATIAAFSLMQNLGHIKSGKYTLETMAGILNVNIDDSGKVLMDQTLPEFYDLIAKSEIENCFVSGGDFIEEAYPIQIVSTGLKDIIVPIKNKDILLSLKPKMNEIIQLSQRYNVIGLHLFTRDTINDTTAHCRNFAPLYEIPEESATGTSNGALACYLWNYGLPKVQKVCDMVFEQGYCMNRPSEIVARLEAHNEKITAVRVGGNAILTNKIQVSI